MNPVTVASETSFGSLLSNPSGTGFYGRPEVSTSINSLFVSAMPIKQGKKAAQ